jgi:hypothetical protein
MKSENELEIWRREWQSQPRTPIDLIRKVEQQTVHMKYYRLMEYLVTIVMGGGTVAAAIITRDPNVALLAVGTVVAIALAWRFVLKHTRGLWTPGAPTTEAYIDLSIRRCRWMIADARYDSIQGVLLTAFVFYVDYRILVGLGKWTPPGPFGFWILGAVICLVLVSAFSKRGKKAKAELEYLTDLQSQVTDTLY